jgi:hypothetical protein
METADSSKMLVSTYRTTHHHDSEDGNLNTYHYRNLKPHKIKQKFQKEIHQHLQEQV